MLPIPDAESIVFNALVKTGSRYEDNKISGVAHFLEHLFYKGSKKYPEPTSISSAIDAIGGDFNAATSKESTEFYIRAAKKHADLVFDVMTDMLQNPLFKKEEIKKEKGVVIEEINLYQDNPGVQVENDLEMVMWPNAALGRDIIGTKQSVSNLSHAQITGFKKKHYVPGNMILGFSGAFDEKKLLRRIEETWGRLPAAKISQSKKTVDDQQKQALEIKFKNTQQAHLALGFKSVPYKDRDSLAASLIGAILGGGSSSRLFVEIRERQGLAYFVRAYNNRYSDAGNFTIHAGLKIEKTLDALSAIMEELARIKNEKISEAELNRAKEYLKGRTALYLEDDHEKLDWLMERFAFYGELVLPKEIYSRYDSINAEDIMRVANRIFTNESMNLAVIGPFKNKKEFQKRLLIQ